MKKIIFWFLIITLTVTMLVGCEMETAQEKEYRLNREQLGTFQSIQPIPVITYSNTRAAVIKRIERWNDPNKVSYIYLVDYGRVMAFYTVKGSVESKRSYLSPTMKPLPGYNGTYPVVDAPDVDGTYGDNANSIFFFNSDDVYVEWGGNYLWVDQPLQFATQPELIYVAPLKE
jgi:hypothetical protein